MLCPCVSESLQAFLIEDDPKNIQFVGNRTECALLMVGKNWGSDYKSLRSTYEKDVVKVRVLSGCGHCCQIEHENKWLVSCPFGN